MENYGKLSREELIRLLMERDGDDLGGIRMSYPGQRPPWQIVRQVKPRSQKIERKLSHGSEIEQSENLIIEGENLQALVSLYKYRGQVDLILTDPPYNTGLDFRYNDRWDEDPNDPDLGKLVLIDDGSRHSKWLRFMKPRVWMMKEMLKPSGVFAICIDHRELYRLGMLLDEIFGESNRIGIINWQKSYAPRNDQKHLSTATEYVLVYAIQAEQVIGRVLRQPGAQHYADPDLNTANFYIRLDSKQEFPRILDAVRRKIASEMPEVSLEGFSDPRDRRRARLEPKSVLTIPEIHIDAEEAVEPLQEIIDLIPDYTSDPVNVFGPGELTKATQRVGDGSAATVVTERREHSNRVIARWLVRRAMQAAYPEATKTIDWTDLRFEALVEVTSVAAHDLRHRADLLVDAFIDNAGLTFEDRNPYKVVSVLTKPDHIDVFNNAGHPGYSDLGPDELDCARAIDALGHTWVRNPSNGGYSIPLLEKGSSRRFFPDFIVWKEDLIYAIDPKGAHLIINDAALKLLSIRDETGKERVLVRLISNGKWKHDPIKQVGKGGYAVWRMNAAGKPRCTNHDTMEAATKKALDL